MKNVIAGMLTLFVLSSCCQPGSDSFCRVYDLEAVRAKFQEKKSAWEALGNARYSFTFDWFTNAEHLPGITVFVYPDKEPETVTHLDDIWEREIDITTTGFFYAVKGATMSDIYTWMEKVLYESAVERNEYGVKIEYSKTYPYPVSFRWYPLQQGLDIGDTIVGDFVVFNITAFEDRR